MNTNRNNQSGFAIGTILLAVILIAAIVSAIAIASRGSSTQGDQERARVNASTAVSQGINLANGFQRLTVGGTAVREITANDQLDIANTNAGASCSPTGAGTVVRTTPARTFQCLYGSAGAGAIINPPRQIFRNNVAPAVGYRFNRNATNIAGNTTAQSVMYTYNLTRAVCQQINNQVNGLTINSQVPVVAAISLGAATAVTEIAAIDLAATNVTGVVSSAGAVSAADILQWSEGCFNYTGTITSNDADYTYVYIKHLGGGDAT